MRSTVLVLIIFTIMSAFNAHANTKLENNAQGKWVVNGSAACKKDARVTFCGMVLWLQDQTIANVNERPMSSVNVDKLQVVARIIVPVADEKVQNYSFDLDMRIKNDSLFFYIYNISCKSNGILGGLLEKKLDKVNLKKKPAQKVLFDKFELVCEDYIPTMLSAILNRTIDVSRWDDMCQGQVVKGMSGDECLVAVGKPDSVTKNSQREQWQYASGMILVLEGGKVTAILK